MNELSTKSPTDETERETEALMQADENRAPFLIVGCPRTGTTLVAQILDSHSQLAVYLETQFYPVFKSIARYYGDLSRANNLRRFATDVLRQVQIQGVEPPDLDAFVASIRDRTFQGVFAALIQNFAEAQGKVWGGEKTPTHCIHLEEIFNAFPDCKIIFLMRDPRDVVHSMQKRWDTRAEAGAAIWNQCFESYDRFKDRLLLVQYESLVARPNEEILRFCDFLGLDVEPGLFKHYENIPDHVRKRHPDMGLLDRAVSTSSVGKFAEMDPVSIGAIENICARGMAAMGYEPVVPTNASPSPPLDSPVQNTGPGFFTHAFDRLRYYGLDRERWRRGAFRWKLQLWLPLRYWLTLGPIFNRSANAQ